MQKKIAAVMIAGLLAVVTYYVFIMDDPGRVTYINHCGACHVQGKAGAPPFGNKAAWAPRIAKGIDVLYANTWNGVNGMPPQGGKAGVSRDDINSAVDYIVSNSGG
uniref:Cytochrome C oxidase, cbb3-type, subunit III n=1 Tax=Candidatus Kentrum sp. TUN TaxID=2126343 RepID=A0A450ZQI7_9GAMM|nr:MAG: Cytochrome C oxidase, cbb3-type, subunit III [Candidatus Kentron sp. TUN]VFK62286.1 MAG: Cytochrome C oxidase, cbb3-type, subunit III [Candidatus Kentron sp. TUN]VFK63005.1 MAG: Cytochrome C oxidase, cbb3-type, subunit III [Candidatus Kentron sp. TUN]